jgi:hypothetical protein
VPGLTPEVSINEVSIPEFVLPEEPPGGLFVTPLFSVFELSAPAEGSLPELHAVAKNSVPANNSFFITLI